MNMGPERMVDYYNISILMDKAWLAPASDHEGCTSSTVLYALQSRPSGARANSTAAKWAAAEVMP